MKFHRIIAIILRFLFHFRHSLDKILDNFYWPAVDLVLWGLTGFYFTSLAPNASIVHVAIVSAIIFWFIIYRGQYEISGNVLEDIWNKNLVNIFVSPLTFSEWVTAFLLLGVVKAILSFSFGSLLAFLLYRVNIFSFGFLLLPFLLLLIMNGWWIGFFVSGLILRYTTRVQAFAWTLVWAISPFAALYYPVSILPDWAQVVARFVPASHIFEGVREVVSTGRLDPMKLLWSFLLNCLYLVLALLFLRQSFRAILRKGLVKLH